MVDAEVRHSERGPFGLLVFRMNAGDVVYFEAGAYAYHEGDLDFRTTSGGVGAALKRAVLGGESFFLNEARARGPSTLALAPPLPGDIVEVPVGGGLVVRDTGYLAHVGQVRVTTRWMGWKGLVAGGGFFWLKLEGRGRAWLSAYGVVVSRVLAPGEAFYVDDDHLLAVEEGVSIRARKLGGLKSFLFGGEGIVFEVRGPGRVLIQTRSPGLLRRLLARR